jgi:cytidylate kinase
VTGIAPAAIAIAGPIGAGKTTLAALLSTQLGWPRTAYSDVLRGIAASQGLPASRSCLQQLGAEAIAGGWDAFTALLLQQATRTAGRGLVVDGLRHREAAAALAAAVRPWHTYLIFLDIPPGLGLDRAARRDQLTDSTWRQSASHPMETELPAVKAIAHLVIHVTAVSPQRAAQLIMFCLSQQVGELSGALCA